MEKLCEDMKEMKIDRKDIKYEKYKKEDQELISKISDMMSEELSEPYSVFTYYYFLEKWGDLCYMAIHNNKLVGVILGKLEPH